MKLRKLSKLDLPVRVEWMNTPDIYKSMNFIPPISTEKTNEWYLSIKDNAKRFDATFVDENEKILAFGGLTNIDYSVRKAEFYVFVNPDMHKKGLGTTSTALLCKYGFDILQLHKICLYTNATNVAARKTYEKVGFKLEGIHRDEKIVNGQYEDRLYYGLIFNDFNDFKLELDLTGGE